MSQIKKILISIVAVLILAVGGYIGLVTDEECESAEVQVLLYQDQFWCGTTVEANALKTKMINKLPVFKKFLKQRYETYLVEEGIEPENLTREEKKHLLEVVERHLIRLYVALVEQTDDFYDDLEPVLVDDVEENDEIYKADLVNLHVEMVIAEDEYRKALEPVFAAKYDPVKDEFSGELVYQQIILREVIARKFQEVKGDDDYFDWFSLGDSTTERFYGLLIY